MKMKNKKKSLYTFFLKGKWTSNFLCPHSHFFFSEIVQLKKNLGLSLFFSPPPEVTWLQSGLISWQGNYLLSFISFAQI